MPPRSVEQRLTLLEQQMHEMRGVPQRVRKVELQILQFQQEVRDEFSATRRELRAEIAAGVASLREAIAETNTHMRMRHEETLTRIATTAEGARTRGRRTKPR